MRTEAKAGLKSLVNPGHGSELVTALGEAHTSGLFADVKLVCGDGPVWAHAATLAAVSPVLRSLLLDHCCSSDVGVTLLMPGLARSDLKVVLDYVYRGWMTLRATQMASVIGVMEVLHLKCGVSVSKRQHSDCDWEPDRVMAFSPDQDRDKAAFLHDLCKIEGRKLSELMLPTPAEAVKGLPASTKVVGGGAGARGPSLSEEDFEAGEPVEVRPVHAPDLAQYDAGSNARTMGLSLAKIPRDPVPVIPGESVVEVEAASSDDDDDSGGGVDAVGDDDDEAGEGPSDASASTSAAAIKCVMCDKQFVHQANLRQHLKVHLGAKAQLKSCQPCDRNFRSTSEYELHLSSHKMARALGRGAVTASAQRRERCRRRLVSRLVRKSARTAATRNLRGNLYRKYVKRALQLQREKEEAEQEKRRRRQEEEEEERRRREAEEAATPASTSFLKDLLEGGSQASTGKVKLKIKVDPSRFKAAATPSQPQSAPPVAAATSAAAAAAAAAAASPMQFNFACEQCPKSFAARSSYLRHVRSKHASVPDTPDPTPPSSSGVRVNFRKKGGAQKRPAESPASTPPRGPKMPKLKLSLPRCDNLLLSDSSTGGDRSPAPTTSSKPTAGGSRRSSEQDLTCPTCDKAFVAKSIFERHLKTYKHGRYEVYGDGAGRTPSYIPEGGTNHMNLVLQPTMEVGGREVAKYECHLCNQVFLRVKDLAKHRERMCTAWK